MRDIAVDENFDVFTDDTNDFAMVEGRPAFNQALAVILTRYYSEIIGSTKHANILKKLNLRAERVILNSNLVSEVQNIDIEFVDDEPGVVEVTIHYRIGDDYVFLLTE